MDPELGDKHKVSKESKKSRKKWKVDKTSGVGVLTNYDYNFVDD